MPQILKSKEVNQFPGKEMNQFLARMFLPAVGGSSGMVMYLTTLFEGVKDAQETAHVDMALFSQGYYWGLIPLWGQSKLEYIYIYIAGYNLVLTICC